MAKQKASSDNLFHYKKNLLPSVAGGGVAFLLTGAAVLSLLVFAAVWAGNTLNHHVNKK
jgi:hypothetical protein